MRVRSGKNRERRLSGDPRDHQGGRIYAEPTISDSGQMTVTSAQLLFTEYLCLKTLGK